MPGIQWEEQSDVTTFQVKSFLVGELHLNSTLVIPGISCFCDMAQMMMRGIPVSGSGLTFCLLPIDTSLVGAQVQERQVQINLFKNPFS